MDQEITNSENFLKQLETTGGFKVADDFFELQNETILASIHEPKLGFEMPTNGFEVPANYFDKAEENILKNVLPKQAKILPFYQKSGFRRIVAVAASVIFIMALGLWFKPIQNQSSSQNETPTQEEMINHLADEDIDASLLCDAGWCNELDNLNAKELNETEKYILDQTDANVLIDEL